MEVDIKRIAKLSRLHIEPEKEEKFRREMQDIIAMVEKLPDVEMCDLAPKKEDTMQLREDIIRDSLPRDEILKNAPQTAAGCVVVPKTIG